MATCFRSAALFVPSVNLRRAGATAPRIQEVPDQIRDLVGGCVEREMTRIEQMDFRIRHIAPDFS
jgi:hypothetical protein